MLSSAMHVRTFAQDSVQVAHLVDPACTTTGFWNCL